MSLTSAGFKGDSAYVDVNAERVVAAAQMEAYLHNLTIGQGWKCGNSIVRSYNIHDGQTFSIEQTVTVYVGRLEKESGKWIGKFCRNFCTFVLA